MTITSKEEPQKEPSEKFFSISPKRLVLCSILSGGLYEIYWMYKNWYFIKQDTKENINPFFRSWLFTIFWIYPLFKTIESSVKNLPKLFKIASVLYTISFMLQMIISRSYILIIISPFILVPIQEAINSLQNTQKIRTQKTFYKGEIAVLIVGFILNYVLAFILFYNGHFTGASTEKINNIGFWTESSYRQIYGYKMVCADEGVVLEAYPEEFRSAFSEELTALNNLLTKEGLTLEKTMELFFSKDFEKNMRSSVYEDLEYLRKESISNLTAQNLGIPINDFVWDDKYNNLLSIKDMCHSLENKEILIFNYMELKEKLQIRPIN